MGGFILFAFLIMALLKPFLGDSLLNMIISYMLSGFVFFSIQDWMLMRQLKAQQEVLEKELTEAAGSLINEINKLMEAAGVTSKVDRTTEVTNNNNGESNVQ